MAFERTRNILTQFFTKYLPFGVVFIIAFALVKNVLMEMNAPLVISAQKPTPSRITRQSAEENRYIRFPHIKLSGSDTKIQGGALNAKDACLVHRNCYGYDTQGFLFMKDGLGLVNLSPSRSTHLYLRNDQDHLYNISKSVCDTLKSELNLKRGLCEYSFKPIEDIDENIKDKKLNKNFQNKVNSLDITSIIKKYISDE